MSEDYSIADLQLYYQERLLAPVARHLLLEEEISPYDHESIFEWTEDNIYDWWDEEDADYFSDDVRDIDAVITEDPNFRMLIEHLKNNRYQRISWDLQDKMFDVMEEINFDFMEKRKKEQSDAE